MKHWQDVIKCSQEPSEDNIFLLNEMKQTTGEKTVTTKTLKRNRPNRSYYVDPPYDGVYFTQREAECLFYLMRGMTIVATAAMLELSPRTVEFYVKNMRIKMNALSKSDLLDRLHEVDFLQKLELLEV